MRTDIHCEKNLVPEDYEVFTWFYIGDNLELLDMNDYDLLWLGELYDADGVKIHEHMDQCDHCGTHFKWGYIAQHKPTGKLLTIGRSCAQNRFDCSDHEYALKTAKNVEKGQKALAKKWYKIRKFARENRTVIRNLNRYRQDSDFVLSVRNQLLERGSLSEKQIWAMERIEDKIEMHKARKEERAKIEDVPTGKATITGTIVSIKFQESVYGPTYKMLVLDDRGFKVWGTLPQKLQEGGWDYDRRLKDKRVTFNANVTASDRDSKFGFFKRPTKVSMEAA